MLKASFLRSLGDCRSREIFWVQVLRCDLCHFGFLSLMTLTGPLFCLRLWNSVLLFPALDPVWIRVLGPFSLATLAAVGFSSWISAFNVLPIFSILSWDSYQAGETSCTETLIAFTFLNSFPCLCFFGGERFGGLFFSALPPYLLSLLLCFPVFNLAVTVLLKYNSYTLQFILSICTVRWFSVYSQLRKPGHHLLNTFSLHLCPLQEPIKH